MPTEDPDMRLTVHGIVAVVAVVALPGLASAQVLTPVAVTPSSTFETYDAVDLINDSGLSGGLHDVEYTNMWISDRGTCRRSSRSTSEPPTS